MKRAIITAFAAIGLSSIAGVSFAETELSGAQLDNVTAGGGMHRTGSFTLQNNSDRDTDAPEMTQPLAMSELTAIPRRS